MKSLFWLSDSIALRNFQLLSHKHNLSAMLAQATKNEVLHQEEVIQTLYRGLERQFSGRRVIVIIPDHTRSLPLARIFRWLVDVLHDVEKLDFLVALGTHPYLSEDQLPKLVGISQVERLSNYKHIGLFEHAWDSPDKIIKIGVLL